MIPAKSSLPTPLPIPSGPIPFASITMSLITSSLIFSPKALAILLRSFTVILSRPLSSLPFSPASIKSRKAVSTSSSNSPSFLASNCKAATATKSSYDISPTDSGSTASSRSLVSSFVLGAQPSAAKAREKELDGRTELKRSADSTAKRVKALRISASVEADMQCFFASDEGAAAGSRAREGDGRRGRG